MSDRKMARQHTSPIFARLDTRTQNSDGLAMNESVNRNHAGAWIISQLTGGYFVTRTYYGYTKRDALRLFREHVRTLSA